MLLPALSSGDMYDMGGGSAHDNGNVNPATQIGTPHTHTHTHSQHCCSGLAYSLLTGQGALVNRREREKVWGVEGLIGPLSCCLSVRDDYAYASRFIIRFVVEPHPLPIIGRVYVCVCHFKRLDPINIRRPRRRIHFATDHLSLSLG